MIIAIVGKKGVGKTRFTAALTNKRYINAPTIDFHVSTVDEHTIIDTPAIETFDKIEQLIFDKTTLKPTLYLILLDGSRELSSLDLDCMEGIRKLNVPFEVIVGFGTDKIDQSALPTNTKYLTNMDEIEDFKANLFNNQLQNHTIQQQNNKNIVLIGKENAGKSTLFNAFAGYERVVVSDQPGTTQQGVQINIKDTLIQDSAGVKSSNVRYVEKLINLDALVVFVLDGTQQITHTDKHLLGIISDYGLACVCALNKSDSPDFIPTLKDELHHLFRFMQIVEISAKNNVNINKLRQICSAVQAKARKKLSTSALSKWIEDSKHLFHTIKVKHAIHVSLTPYEIVCFVSPMVEDKTKIAHVRNLLQAYFKLDGIFVKVKFKSARSSSRAANIPLAQKNARKRAKEAKR